MSTKKAKGGPRKAAKNRTSSKRKVSGLALVSVLALVALVAALLIFGVKATRHHSARLILDEVEEVVGELAEEAVSLQVSGELGGEAIIDKLRKLEAKSLGAFKLDELKRSYGSITGRLVHGQDVYKLLIHWPDEPLSDESVPGTVPPVVPEGGEGPMLAIVIDDMGNDFEIARGFMRLEIPVTPAVLPYLRYSKEIAHLSSQLGRQHILHMPMEPMSYPVNDPGEGAIMTTTPPDEVAELLLRALTEVPGAVGVNNHMGSRATQMAPQMDALMEELSLQGLPFLDSRTTPESVGAARARRAGIPWLVRDIFIDNIRTPEALDERLEAAVSVAKKKGYAIAIGHHYPVTLETLERWQPRFAEEGVTIVPLITLFGQAQR